MVRDKKEIRAGMRRCNRALTEAERQEAAARIFDRVEQTAAFAAARVVALFCALGDEPPTGRALARWSQTKRIVVPRVAGDTMDFYDYRPEELAEGSFGIREPQGGRPCQPGEIDLIVVPGVAFTAGGARLGRGRGYYDRYLSRPEFRAAKIGICYRHQLTEELPVEPHDVRMDEVMAG